MTERGDEFLPELGANGLPADPNWVPPRTESALAHLGRESEKRLSQKMRPFKNAGLGLIEKGLASPTRAMERMFDIAENGKPMEAIRAMEFLRDTIDGKPEQAVEIDSRKVEARVLVIDVRNAAGVDPAKVKLPSLSDLRTMEAQCVPPKAEASSDSKSSESGG